MAFAYIREERVGYPWIDIYNPKNGFNYPVIRCRDMNEARYKVQNLNVVLGCLPLDKVDY